MIEADGTIENDRQTSVVCLNRYKAIDYVSEQLIKCLLGVDWLLVS